jgi:hypothetical protein
MVHAFMYHGGFDTNFTALKSGATTFRGSVGSERVIPDWPAEVDGIRVGYMERPGKRFVAVRVMDDDDDVILEHDVPIDLARHMGYGKRFSPEPTLVDDDAIARTFLRDVISANAAQEVELLAIASRLPRSR